ncbi:diguanylate cyclase [Xenophilus sp. Marseille-Q4582]|uniref:diguanylate cyclase n=1 Tax=Xenophilus sp. Marseille-Q4582 TaxID=2866600 RepID=UPI001CE3F704|nr:diguanylate cyclase [Xenophilus sp. Marseille-Q4582]
MPEQWLLKFGVFPLWVLCGLADWALHRRERIELTAGTREPRIHLLMLAEMGAAVLLVLWFEFTPAVLAVCVLLFVAHELTVYADLRWAAQGRRVGPLEQMVHSGQELLPLVGLALLVSAHADALRPAAGSGCFGGAQWTLKDPGLSPFPLAAAHALGAAVALCYLEEWWRCRRHAGRRRGPGRPAEAP